MTVHDLAADWSWMQEAYGFRVKGGRVVWQEAEYVGGSMRKVRIGRVVSGTRQPHQIVRWVDPWTSVEVLSSKGGS